ncbi:hypothetical protein CROQUDRAFT_104035 [Cronartium quercuum f. sp. fusiforme G11]|uniref:Uncharacterized protein n=1 Tax=Cronartium quercuum f. sp. fusiforme G11 TaxID=708437 RepID=A0A9P6NVH8_9BASI|nr:hypothetical protein CROQUDRAFT_104035 [Cronartium quercuum f. sp. fusiforme G11]
MVCFAIGKSVYGSRSEAYSKQRLSDQDFIPVLMGEIFQHHLPHFLSAPPTPHAVSSELELGDSIERRACDFLERRFGTIELSTVRSEQSAEVFNVSDFASNKTLATDQGIRNSVPDDRGEYHIVPLRFIRATVLAIMFIIKAFDDCQVVRVELFYEGISGRVTQRG